MSELFRERLKQRRIELDMTQEDLAEAADLTPSAISLFEKGSRFPGSMSLTRLSEALRVTPDYLLGKKERDFEDLLADPRIMDMAKGMSKLSEEQRQVLFDKYKWLSLRYQRKR